MWRMMTVVFVMAVMLVLNAQADIFRWEGGVDDNWSTVANWYNETTGGEPASVPGASDIVQIDHNVGIIDVDSDVGTVTSVAVGNNLTWNFDGGTLVSSGGDAVNWGGGLRLTLENSSSITGNNHWVRLDTGGGASVLVDNSTFSWRGSKLQTWSSSDTSIEIRNGATWSTSGHTLDQGSTAFNIVGSGNSVTMDDLTFDAQQAEGNETVTFRFTMDSTDAALSTVNFVDMDLGDASGTRNLIIDTTSWNGNNTAFTLFSGTTLADTSPFNSVAFEGGNSGTIDYDTDNNQINMIIPEPATFGMLGLIGVAALIRRKLRR